jgi:hypothetical protein
MTLRVADTIEVRRWILGYGADAEVGEPTALREMLKETAQGVARKVTAKRKPLAPVASKWQANASASSLSRRSGST